jgi:hypothetical protein
MKTELVANWVVVDGRLELHWSIKDDNRLMMMNRFVSQPSKVA